jgi:hypothetical protein
LRRGALAAALYFGANGKAKADVFLCVLLSRSLFTLTVLALPAAVFAQAAPADAPVSVMFVADFHMSNPGRDVYNVSVDDVLTPGPQAEIAKIADALTGFHPLDDHLKTGHT